MDPRRYRNFGPYWWLVKALLKRHFDRHEMPLLGDYEDPTALAKMPADQTGADALRAAMQTYALNARYNLGSNVVTDADGEAYFLLDPDMEGN